MQKIIFYQETQPKAADALWLHHGYDSNGNKKESISIDYIQNGVVRHIMDAGSGSGSGSCSCKQVLSITPNTGTLGTVGREVMFETAAEAAASLGITEADFLSLLTESGPIALSVSSPIGDEALFIYKGSSGFGMHTYDSGDNSLYIDTVTYALETKARTVRVTVEHVLTDGPYMVRYRDKMNIG